MPSRDDLIADWRNRLAEADESATESNSRPAWLTRLRIRLFRFLLSLYEGGDWNAPQVVEPPSADLMDNATMSASPADVLLDGKPAKSKDQIRHALTAIAGAQDHSLQPGDLAGNQFTAGLIVVASASGHVRTDRLAELLQGAGIWSRVSVRGDDRLVEVRARDREQAFALLAKNANLLRGRNTRGQFEGINFLIGLVTVTVLYAPLATLYILWPLMRAYQQGDLSVETVRFIAPYFFVGWAGCIILYCVYGIWQGLRRR
jgi:hypothetical protein